MRSAVKLQLHVIAALVGKREEPKCSVKRWSSFLSISLFPFTPDWRLFVLAAVTNAQKLKHKPSGGTWEQQVWVLISQAQQAGLKIKPGNQEVTVCDGASFTAESPRLQIIKEHRWISRWSRTMEETPSSYFGGHKQHWNLQRSTTRSRSIKRKHNAKHPEMFQLFPKIQLPTADVPQQECLRERFGPGSRTRRRSDWHEELVTLRK